MFSEWLYLPEAAAAFLCDPGVWLFLIGGVFLGFVVGVVPGLGPTMGMALCLGLVFHLEYTHGMALLVGIFVASCGSGGITASLINIPGTPAAAATCLDGNALTKQGRGREAVGYSIAASVVGTLVGTILIFLIQPFVTGIALKFGDWETFLFCVFGLLICGSISGGSRRRGWIAALAGCLLSLTGADGVQSVLRFTFGRRELLSGFNSVIAMLGLFGLGEVLYTLRAPELERTVEKDRLSTHQLDGLESQSRQHAPFRSGGIVDWLHPRHRRVCRLLVFLRSCQALLQAKEKFGHGSEEGIIAAEVANNACSAGALIPALSLGIPGSSTAAIFLSAMFIMNLRPGPTLLIESPGILCGLCLLLLMAAAAMGVVSFLCSKLTIRILTIPQSLLMPLVAVLCAIGAYSAIGTPFALIQLSLFGLLGYLMKLYRYPIAPFVLGLLVGPTADTSLRRALMQYSDNIFGLICRPFGLGLMAVLALLFVLSLKSERAVRKQQ